MIRINKDGCVLLVGLITKNNQRSNVRAVLMFLLTASKRFDIHKKLKGLAITNFVCYHKIDIYYRRGL